MTRSESVVPLSVEFASRRDLLRGVGSASFLVATAGSLGVPSVHAQGAAGQTTREFADKLFFGGTILTMDDGQPTVEAVAVRRGRILVAGSLAEAEATAGPDTAKQDLKRLTMLPGFFDPHGHVGMVGMQAISANLLPPPDGEGRSIHALKEIYRAWMEGNRDFIDRFGIIMGFGYDDAQLAEQRHPTRQDLDGISTERPVIAMHQSMHLGAVNSKALELAAMTAETVNPPGGTFRREAGTDVPNGVVEENAFFLMLQNFLHRLDNEANLRMVKAGAELYARFGYTTCQDAASSAANITLFKELGERGELPIDVLAFPLILTSTDVLKPPIYGREYVNRLRIGGVKLTIDGSPQGKTAWLTQPYYIPPEGRGLAYIGYPAITPELAMQKIEQALREGWQIQVHANGDAAIDLFLAGVKSAIRKYPRRDHRSVLIHGQTAREDQVDALKELGVIPSFFPMHTFYWGDWHRDSVLGPIRAENISPTGWAYRRGMKFTTHHDAPVANPDSMRVLSATVTRRTRSNDILGPHQRVSPEVALKAMTIWAAWQHYEEETKGSIVVGKLADLVVLSDNPLTAQPEQLAALKVMETIKEGVSVYRNDRD